jgi:hypothetical protein
MILEHAMQALANGQQVYWRSLAYRLMIDSLGRALVKCDATGDVSLAIHCPDGFFTV